MDKRESYIKLDHLSVGYNHKPLIEDICLDIQKGDIVTLIGPNGAGKSTILKTLTRQLAMVKGKVTLDANNLGAMSYKELAKKMSIVMTERMKPDMMTCQDIVATGRYPYTGRMGVLTAEDEAKVDEALEAVNAREISNRDFNAISDGQRQRVLLARAICQEPEVIILDEPTSFLDIHYKLELLSILRRMAKEKDITVVMTLHEIDLAQKISDKIVCVHGDRILDFGRPEEIFKEDKIKELYDIDNGFYDPLFGSIELPRPTGPIKAFVISAAGSGIKTYRRLQKENIPFAAGILYENDIDFALARLLAMEVVSQKPFDEITTENIQKAKALIDRCEKVIDCGLYLGQSNQGIQQLYDYSKNKLIHLP